MDIKKFNKIRSSNPFLPLSDIVYELLLRDIISFRLHPGARISENAISQELSISRSPVKTALEKLVDRRFAKTTNNRYYVSDFDPEYYKEICDFTMMIEPFAAKKAARNIKPEQLEELYRISDRLAALYQEAYASGKDFGFTKLLDQEMAFHYGVVKASGNGLISGLYEEHKYEVWRFRGCLLYSRPEGFFNTVDTDHRLICDILKLGDGDLAAAVTKRHLHVSRDSIERYELIDHF